MKRFFQFPELLLLALVLFSGIRSFPLSFALIISWGFHVVLRSKYPAHYPAFGSWVHAVLSVLLEVTLLVVLYWAGKPLETKPAEIGIFLFLLTWGTAAGGLGLLLMGAQLVFWAAAIHSLWERGKKRRPRVKG
jgi:hypothetical protein